MRDKVLMNKAMATTIEDLDLEEVPDIVLSLLGAGAPLDDEDDMNGRKAYYDYVEKKHV